MPAVSCFATIQVLMRPQDTVTQDIEQQNNGNYVPMYMSSTSDSAATIARPSSPDRSDIAQVQVQNKLQLATPLLPGGPAAGYQR